MYNFIKTRSKTLIPESLVSINGTVYEVGTLRSSCKKENRNFKKAKELELSIGGRLLWLTELPVVISKVPRKTIDVKVVQVGDIVGVKGEKGKFRIQEKRYYLGFYEFVEV